MKREINGVEYEIEPGVNLSYADLFQADFFGSDLSYVNFSHANLSHATFFGANLSHTNLYHANLSHVNFSGANLSHANFSGANVKEVEWPAPTMVLLAEWRECSDELTLELMRYDASNHLNPKSFIIWRKNNLCPYTNENYKRCANFSERSSLITPSFLKHRVQSAITLMMKLLEEKCICK
jgi:uncharacterized protein YjbI with pentapeptide repeats